MKNLLKIITVLFFILLNVQFQAQIDGTLDTTFGIGGKLYFNVGITGSYATSVKTEQNGKFTICGTEFGTPKSQYFLMKFKTNGDRDSLFGTNGLVEATVNIKHRQAQDMEIQSDGKYVVLGIIADSIKNSIFLTRHHVNGALDSTFGINGMVQTEITGYRDIAYKIKLQTDSKIVVCGYVQSTSTSANLIVIRYNTDGTLDTAFDTDGIMELNYPAGLGEFGSNLIIQNDGKILVSGYYWSGPYNSDIFLVRLNTNGSLDLSFNTDGMVQTAISASVDGGYSVKVLANGNIMVGGESTGGTTSTRYFTLVKYLPNGSMDYSFDFDGIVTTSFNSPYCTASSLLLDSNGKMILVGSNYYNSSNDFALARYNQNGSLDNTFNFTGKTLTDFYNTNDVMTDAALQFDNKIIVVGGSSTTISIARYLNSISTTNAIDLYKNEQDKLIVYPNPSTKQITINSSLEFDEVQLFTITGELLLIEKFKTSVSHPINISELPVGIYIIKILADSKHIKANKLLKN